MTYIATYFRGNSQSRNGGYNTTRTIKAKTLREATKKVLDGVEITGYNKGKIDGIKELVKELKQHSCFYDSINYISFEAVDIEAIDEIAETMIKKIS